MQTESAAMLLMVLFLPLVTWPDKFLSMYSVACEPLRGTKYQADAESISR